MRRFFLFVTLLLAATASRAQLAIEDWRDHFPYTGALGITHGNQRVFCATPFMVFSYHLNDNSIEKLSKVNALSDVGISAIAFDETSKTLVVGYENGNLDLVKQGVTVNINSILNADLFGIKRINHIRVNNGKAWLSCGFGIVNINLVEEEIIDTYIIGPGAVNLQVHNTVRFNDKLLAATDIGLFQADADNAFLANFANWSPVNSLPDAGSEISDLEIFNNRIFLIQRLPGDEDKILYSEDLATWSEMTSGNDINYIDASDQRLIVSGFQFIDTYNQNLVLSNFFFWGENGQQLLANGALMFNPNEVWVADGNRGIVRYQFSPAQWETIRPSGPKRADSYELRFENNRLFKTSGSPAGNWSPTFNTRGFEVFFEGEWQTFDHITNSAMAQNFIWDVMTVISHPDDENRWYAGTWGKGLLEFQNGEVVNYYTHENSPLQGAPETANQAAVGGLIFDEDDNLWITNGYADTPLLVLTPEGDWKTFSISAAGAPGSNLLSQVLINQSGHKWLVRARGGGLAVYDHKNDLDNDEIHEAVTLNSQVGSGNLPTLDVFAIAEDLNGEIWVGTGEGVAVFYAAGSVFNENSNTDAQQILLEQDGNIQILLETEQVRAIAVDGGNRKWLGTSNSGVFLMSPDGTSQVYHFTVDNSPLPSNTVQTIAIDGATGEVFFGTDQGVVSFRSTATEGSGSNECAKVFPNPVPSGYEGPVAISGLQRNTNVKITDIAGNLVYETTSEGGQAIWNATNFRGERVTTGVYNAICVAPENESGCVAKIMVIR